MVLIVFLHTTLTSYVDFDDLFLDRKTHIINFKTIVKLRLACLCIVKRPPAGGLELQIGVCRPKKLSIFSLEIPLTGCKTGTNDTVKVAMFR